MKYIIFALILIASTAYAELPFPPIIKDVDRSLQQYLIDIYNNRNVVSITTTSPNGNRIGNKGEIVIYNNNLWYNNSSTNSVLWIKI